MADQYDDPTANYSWNLPDEGGDTNVWGTKLNDIFGGTVALGAGAEGIDSVIKTVSDVADAAMARAGGTFTGHVIFGNNCAARENKITALSTGTVDWSKGNFFVTALKTGVTDWETGFVNYPSDPLVQFITIQLTQPGAGGATVTWPTEVLWQDGTAPTLSATADSIDVLVFYTTDGGVTVIGAHSITNPL